LVLAIVADEIPYERRGAATGTIMAAFSLASIIGVPLGIALATHWSWHAPFALLAVLGGVVFVVAAAALPTMRSHLNSSSATSWASVAKVWKQPNHWRTFAFTVTLMFAGFSVIPFISPYLVANVGFAESDLPLVYLFGGICTVLTSPLIGRLADRLGKHRIFTAIALISLVPIFVVTHLGQVSKPVAFACTTVFIVFVSGRFVPAMALVSSSAEPALRGRFMSINGAIQSAASGCAAWLAGAMITKGDDGRLMGYELVGYVAMAATLGCLVLVRRVGSAGDARHLSSS
jgi:predicted MFS family arabinose efflux permease